MHSVQLPESRAPFIGLQAAVAKSEGPVYPVSPVVHEEIAMQPSVRRECTLKISIMSQIVWKAFLGMWCAL